MDANRVRILKEFATSRLHTEMAEALLAEVFSQYQFGYGEFPHEMRVRILRTVAGVLDGQSLGKLTPGLLYELDDAFARQLVSMGCAREENSQAPALVMRAADEPLDEARLTGGVRVVPRETAMDDSTPNRRLGIADRRKHPRTDRRKLRS